MKRDMTRPPKIAICRRCGGRGYIIGKETDHEPVLCSQCLGSGRVTVSAEIVYDIRPYKPKE